MKRKCFFELVTLNVEFYSLYMLHNAKCEEMKYLRL